MHNCRNVSFRNIDKEKILHGRQADVAVAIALREIGGEGKLRGGGTAAKNGGTDGEKPGLMLRDNAEVIAMDGWRRIERLDGIKGIAKARFNSSEERFRGPGMLEKKIFHARFVAGMAENLGVFEDLSDGANNGNSLVPMDESVERHGEVRLGGEAARDAYREADFIARGLAASGNQGDVIDFRIRAPIGAGGDRDFELSREIVIIRIAAQFLVDGRNDGPYIREFMGVDAGKRATSDVADNVAASPGSCKLDGVKSLEELRNGLYANPVELNVLANGDIRNAVAEFRREVRDGVELVAG